MITRQFQKDWYRSQWLWFTTVICIVLLVGLNDDCPAKHSEDNSNDLNSARMCAEWEPALGTLIRWPIGIPVALVVELAEDDSLYVLVENQSQENQAISNFQSWGVNLDHCHFIRANTYSHWTRDWGPHSVFNSQGDWTIMDPVFDGYPWVPGKHNSIRDYHGFKGYEEDDLVNGVVAQELACSLVALPAYLTGGNIMVDGHGTAFSTQQMVDENSSLMTESEFFILLEDYAGLTDYHILSNTEDYGIQHIDCSAKLLDEETVMIQELPSWHPEKWRMDRLVAEFESLTTCYGNPYEIVRVYCGSYNGNSTAAYTNSLILNKKILVPMFNIASDSTALQTYREAMPGYEVIGFYYANWYYYDALHCRTMAIFDRHMLRITHNSPDSLVENDTGFELTAFIDDRSQAGLVLQDLQIKWRKQNEVEWDSVYLEEIAVDSFSGVIPTHDDGVVIEYYFEAGDSTGRFEVLPRGAPQGFFSFYILPGPVKCGDANSDDIVDVSDAVYIINYAFAGGPAPDPEESGDVNCDDGVDVSDAVYIINYAFAGGNAPCDTNGDDSPDC